MKTPETFANIFVRPYIRRMKFLYTGISNIDNVYFLGTDNPEKYGVPKNKEHFKFCYPGQSIGVVKITSQETKELVQLYLSIYGEKLNNPGHIDILKFSSYMSKIKWDIDKIERSVVDAFWVPIDNQFIVMQLVALFDRYSKCINKESPTIYLDISENDCIMDDYAFKYRGEDFAICAHLVKGYDRLILQKDQSALFSGIRLWEISKEVYGFGYVLQFDDSVVFGTRTNSLCMKMPNLGKGVLTSCPTHMAQT
jgi:hypothetical protein